MHKLVNSKTGLRFFYVFLLAIRKSHSISQKNMSGEVSSNYATSVSSEIYWSAFFESSLLLSVSSSSGGSSGLEYSSILFSGGALLNDFIKICLLFVMYRLYCV